MVEDATLTATVKTKLIADDLTEARNINVDTMRSVVTLKGEVGSQAEADKAIEIARGTDGVSQVLNELVIKPN